MGKAIVVTGGLGFIGSHLCLRLLKDGHKVMCLDDLSTGQIEHLGMFDTYPNFKFIRHDIADPIFFENKVDEIYNLACPASPVHYQHNPVKTTQTSVVGTMNMLELARIHGCKILQASTSEVYGDPKEHPQRESYYGNVNINGIRSCYDEGKRCAESLCLDYHRQFAVRVKIIRIFNTYGPNMAQNDGRVISNFILQALKNKDITIYGDGTQTRSFQYVDDLIEGMIRMMDTDDDFTGPVNIGNPEEVTISHLAEEVIGLVHSGSKICYCSLPSDDPCRRCPDITLAHKVLNGWEPHISLKEGLKKTIDYFRCCTENLFYEH